MFMGLQAKGKETLTAVEIQHSPLTEKNFVHEKGETSYNWGIHTLSNAV